MEAFLGFLDSLPALAVYLILGLGAALENVVPPVPADTFVVLGGVLAGRNTADPWIVFAVTWMANVAGALLVYGLGLRHGEAFFRTGRGRLVLNPGQLDQVQRFYDRFGTAAMFFTRFLPGLRAVVPVFAGVTRQPLGHVVLPLALASAAWYGGLVWVGTTMGRNLAEVSVWLRDTNRVLLGVAVVLVLAVVGWWWKSRGSTGDG